MFKTIDYNLLSLILSVFDISVNIIHKVAYNKYLEYQYIQAIKKISFNIDEHKSKKNIITYLQQFEKIHHIYKSTTRKVQKILEKTILLIYEYEASSLPTSYLDNRLDDFYNYIINLGKTNTKDIDKFSMIFGGITIFIFILLLAFCMYYMFFY